MNRIAFFVILTVALSAFSCQNGKDDLNRPISEKDVYKTIGEKIPYETGMEWIAFYEKDQPDQARLGLIQDYQLSGNHLNSLLASTTTSVGVAFHYAIDDSGDKHIIAIPVDESLDLGTSASGRILIDGNTDSPIDFEVAKVWAQRYRAAHPNEIWFHFFGKNIFDDMRALPYFDTIDIEPAINILNLKPQLLLVISNDLFSSSGRTATDDEPGTVYDASNPCPPCAVN